MIDRRPSVLTCFAALAASVLSLAPLGCQSSDDDDAGDEASGAGADVPSPVEVPPRGDAAPAGASSGPSSTAGGDSATAGAGAQAPSNSAQASTPAAAEGAGAPAAGEAAAPAQAFEACLHREGSYGGNCDTIFVTMKQASPARCVQLTIDDCGSYNRPGIPVSLPASWRLSSGSIRADVDECELGVTYTDRTGVEDASGSISWNESTRLPTELVIDVTLEPASSGTDIASIDMATPAPLELPRCAE